jgi:hypothetical protein
MAPNPPRHDRGDPVPIEGMHLESVGSVQQFIVDSSSIHPVFGQ